MATQVKYRCTLDEASVKKAAAELHEDPKERDSAVANLRLWIEQNSSWLKSPTDTKFLLPFLRCAKFVQLAARKRLVNYWTSRTECKEWFADVDTLDPKMTEMFKLGSFIGLPKRDGQGRGVLVANMSKLDMSKYTLDDISKASVALIDWMMMDENVQVNGLIFLQDMAGFSVKQQSFITIDHMKKSMKFWTKGYPARYKGVHYVNTNPIFDAFLTLTKQFMPEKLKQRLYVHGPNICEVYESIEKSVLPVEYLPDDYTGSKVGTLQDCIENQVKQLHSAEVRDYLLHLSTGPYGVDQSRKPSDDELFAESFRRLNVD